MGQIRQQSRRMIHLMRIRSFWPHWFGNKHYHDLRQSKQEYADNNWGKFHNSELLEVYEIGLEGGMSLPQIQNIWWAESCKMTAVRDEYKKRPKREGRDNKDVHVLGGGDGNRNKVRYPKKNRSLATWRRFYKLFPRRAKLDGWNGTKSKRYP